MPRNIDFRQEALTDRNLVLAFTRVFADVTYATGIPMRALDLPYSIDPAKHLGAFINASVDAADSRINQGAQALGRVNPSNGSRLYDFTTGYHDTARLHAELDRLHDRASALSSRSLPASADTAWPLAMMQTPITSTFGYLAASTNAWAYETGENPPIGLPWVNRKNLILHSSDWTSASAPVWTTTATRTAGGGNDPFGNVAAYPNAVFTLADTSAASQQSTEYAAGATPELTLTYSVYIQKKYVAGHSRPGLYVTTSRSGSGSQGYAVALLDVTTGAMFKATDSTMAAATVPASAIDAGDYWRAYITFPGAHAVTTLRVVPAAALPGGTATTITATGTCVATAPQLEVGSTPTTYQATSTAGVDVRHPVNGGGMLVEGSRGNLLLRSGDFSSSATWIRALGGITLPTPATGPDGVASSAWSVTPWTTDNYLVQNVSLGNGTMYTFSVWLRSNFGEQNINIYGLSNGTTATYQASRLCAVTTVWKRFFVTFSTSGASSWQVQIGGGTTWTGDVADDGLILSGYPLEIAFAQLEQGHAPTSYIPTTTATVFRYGNNVAVAPTQNLLRSTADVSNTTYWTRSNLSSVVIGSTAPDGTATGATLTKTAVSGSGITSSTFTVPFTGQYVFSVWLKSGTLTRAALTLDIGGVTTSSNFTDLDGTWRRYTFRSNYITAGTTLSVRIYAGFFADTTAGSIQCWGPSVNYGTAASPYVRANDTAFTAASDGRNGAPDGFEQNGFVQFNAVWSPSYTTEGALLANRYFFGSAIDQKPFAFMTYGGTQIYGKRESSDGVISNQCFVTDATLTQSGGPALFRLEWQNYVVNGTRTMPLRLYIDGVLRHSIDAVSSGKTAWSTIPNLIAAVNNTTSAASDVCAVISNLQFGVLQVPTNGALG